jgi:hypothetical protein
VRVVFFSLKVKTTISQIVRYMNRFLFLLLLGITVLSCRQKTLMEAIPSEHSGIRFANTITDNDTLNVLDVENIYNGGGVGIADFNNDGLRDIYFSGNTVSNKLYLNKGDFKFDDVTTAAAVDGAGRWCRGVSVVDINNDGWMDIYVCATLLHDSLRRQNLLYINQGADKNGVPHFKEMAAEYRLNDMSHSTMAAFFDYDNDGDLDMYLLVNEIIKNQYPNTFRPILKNGEHPGTDRLFRNDWNDSLGHPVFTNVSREAGILLEGYGHSVNITDINRDGWKDIYVANDFLSNNILYINNGDGTFTDKVEAYFRHTAENAMGMDITDINNDGLVDVVELDMNPEDNYRKKMMMNPQDYTRYQNNALYGYQHQYVRNVLQVNQGPTVSGDDSISHPVFSDVAFQAGIAETDWSWTPLVADFDNDGYRDIIITNGFPKDVTDHDFIAYRQQVNMFAGKQEILENIPVVKIPNYAYRNTGNLQFTDVTEDWGLKVPSFSNGAAYADFDNDGDLDVVMNNINQEAFLYRNRSEDRNNTTQHSITLHLRGDSGNRQGLGAWIELHYAGKKQVWENTPYRGYLSSVQADPQFGLGAATVVDTILVKWPDGKVEMLRQVKAGVVNIDYKNAVLAPADSGNAVAANALFRNVTAASGIQYVHSDSDYIDFNIQKLLPHKLSEYGPALAAGDIDGNGLDDIIIGGAFHYSAQLLLQQPGEKFVQKSLLPGDGAKTKQSEDMGLALFDADGDGDLDLYIAAGSYEAKATSEVNADRFYRNDGKGNFTPDNGALPQNLTSKSCVRVADFDRDGDLDFFLAGRLEPGAYPKPVSSFIYRNDSKNSLVKFTDVTAAVAPNLKNIGMVCDALWTDMDNDGWPDLLLAGEWMPLTFLKNKKGQLHDSKKEIGGSSGWWNSLVPGDFDNDGDIDYVVGNLGQNSYYKGNEQYPVSIYFRDFDKNGTMECVSTRYMKDEGGQLKEFPIALRDPVADQMPFLKKRFLTYRDFAKASVSNLFTADEKKELFSLQATYFKTALLENKGSDLFVLHPLPKEAQQAPVYGMVAEDVDGDGNLDLLLNGNDYGMDVATGRHDAFNGLLMKGDGKGSFSPLSILQSGIYLPGNGKALVKLRGSDGSYLVAGSQNRGPLALFALKRKVKTLSLQPTDVAALVTFKNGKTQRRELYSGTSFLSQSGHFLAVDDKVASVTLLDAKGVRRALKW